MQYVFKSKVGTIILVKPKYKTNENSEQHIITNIKGIILSNCQTSLFTLKAIMVIITPKSRPIKHITIPEEIIPNL